MAYKIEDTKVFLTRGDTFQAEITIYTDDSEQEIYTPEAGDVVRFALKRAKMTSGDREFADKEPLILKDIPIDTLILEIEPEDTKNLDFGTYVYDIELTTSDGTVSTFIADATLVLTPEVY